MATTYSEFKLEESSDKITLVTMEASNRLKGWVLDSGTVFKLTGFNVAVISSIEDSGVALTAVASVASITPGTYFNDRDNSILFMETTDSLDPNTKFMVLTKKLFFSNFPVTAPNDLALTGEEVFWEPLLQSTSQFGVELDNRNQLGIAIEGKGTISFINDADSPDTNSFWRNNYATLFFENHRVEVYSYNSLLPIDEAKLIFKGRVKSKKYSPTRISFQVQDLLSELRGEVQLTNLEDVSSTRVSDNLLIAKGRRIYGRVFGNRPTNISEVLDGFPLTGTVSVTTSSATVTGSGTSFLKEISPEDKLTIATIEVSVESVTSDTSLTLSEDFSGTTASGLSITIVPALPKQYINRDWLVANHATREPVTTVVDANSLNVFEVGDATDIKAGDQIFVGASGTGELVTVDRVNGDTIKSIQNLIAAPSVGTAVKRPSVQNLKINNTLLRFDRDFTYDASTGRLTLEEDAEFSIAPIQFLTGTLTFTTSSRAVTATGSFFLAQLQPGNWIRSTGEADFFEILSIESDTALTLRTASTYTATAGGQYKPVVYFDPGTDVLSCDIIGITEDGTTTGTFIEDGPQVVKHLIEDAGITDIDTASFTTSSDLADGPVGLVIPDGFADTSTDTFRDYINRVNRSIFGSLIQNTDFDLEYVILSPNRDTTIEVFREFDVIKFSIDTTNEYMAKEVIIEYKSREYNAVASTPTTTDIEIDTSQIAEFILRTDRTTRIETLLSFQKEAIIFARRYRHILEIGHTVITMTTKLQASELNVTDKVNLQHEKLFKRIGGGSEKVSAIQSIRKSGSEVTIKMEDLADALTRSSTVTVNTASNFANSTDGEKLVQGYITDNNAMISNDGDTDGLHTIF